MLKPIASGEKGNPLLVSSFFAHIGDVCTFLAELEQASIGPAGEEDDSARHSPILPS